MTSGNVSDEPIAHEDEDALARLAGIADLVLCHDRPIHTRTDDSVVRAVPARRRCCCAARVGSCPTRCRCRGEGRPLLACGAELKSTFCVAKGARAWVSHHIGDLEVLRGAAGLRGGDRALRAPVRNRARGRRPRRASGLPLDPVRARPRRRRDRRGPAPPRPPRGVPGRARRDRAARPERSTTARATAATAASGAARSSPATCATSSAPRTCGRSRLPGGDAAVRQPWRMAVAWLLEAGWDGPLPGRTPIRSPSSFAPASRRRGRRAWGGSSTPSRRCAGCATR